MDVVEENSELVAEYRVGPDVRRRRHDRLVLNDELAFGYLGLTHFVLI
jgi:hypothetical protein